MVGGSQNKISTLSQQIYIYIYIYAIEEDGCATMLNLDIQLKIEEDGCAVCDDATMPMCQGRAGWSWCRRSLAISMPSLVESHATDRTCDGLSRR
jgi:hypothetical protein